MSSGGRIFLFILFVIAAAGCNSKESLTPLATALDQIMGYGSVDAHFCTTAPSPSKQKVKYIFVLDHSASNKPGFPPAVCAAGSILVTNVDPNACWTLCGNMTTQAINPSNSLCQNITTDLTNTDQNGDRRYGPMVNFIQNMVPDPNNLTSFNLIDFSDTPWQAQNLFGFDPSTTSFIQNRVSPDWIGPAPGTPSNPFPADGGFTDYDAALQNIAGVIRNDAQLEAATAASPPILSQYVIIFVSDGVPTIPAPTNNGVCTEQYLPVDFAANPCGTEALQTDVAGPAGIMAIKNDPVLGPYISSITLNTAYYFNDQADPNAEGLLQQMAAAGNGQFLEFGNGSAILYQRFAPPSRNIVNQLADVFVQNVNGVWWDDGRFMADTDGDGLPDLIEMQYGSDPNNPDTDGNGVSDYVEFRTKGTPCKDPQCRPAKRDPYAICAGYSPVTDALGNVTFAKSSNDGLNDCEKFLLGGQIGSFNSTGDLIPDFLGAVNTLPILPGSSGTAYSDPFGDGVTNYSKLKLGLPIQVSEKTLLDVQTRDTNLTVDSRPSATVTCYHYIVNHVALAATTNLIKLMVVENNSTVQDKPFMIWATQPLDGNGVATFSPGDLHP